MIDNNCIHQLESHVKVDELLMDKCCSWLKYGFQGM